MKCLLCIHYDVVELSCSFLREKLNSDEPVYTEPDWGCKDYQSATSINLQEKLKITIDIGL